MATTPVDTTISGLPHNPGVASGDKIEVLDVSNTTNQATGENTYATVAEVLSLASGGSAPPMGASGPSHAAGLVPDPGATAGTTRFLREDATFAVPPSGGGGGTPGGTNGQIQYNASGAFGGLAIVPAGNLPAMVASGASHAAGLVPDPGATAGTTRFLREDATFAVPSAGTVAPFFSITGIGTSVVNTITPTSIFTGAVLNPGSLTIPANRLTLGGVIRMYLWGDYDFSAGSPTITFDVKLGGSVVLTGYSLAGGSATTVRQWRTIEPIYLGVQAIGASGKIAGNAKIGGLLASYTENFFAALTQGGLGLASAPTTINTTAPLAIDVEVTWSAADPSNRIRLLGGSCWIDG